MKIIDMHLHLYPFAQVVKEGKWGIEELDKNLNFLSQRLKKCSIEKGMAIIADSDFLRNNQIKEYLKRNTFSDLCFCVLIDFRNPDFRELLKTAKDLGIKAVKIHPGQQKITKNDFEIIGEFAKEVEKLGLFIVIDCVYLTKEVLYGYRGIKLSAYLSDLVSCPIIMAHSGGAEVLEALCVAEETSNLYLETSFSLNQWKGSSVEQDLAFAFKKIGSSRCIYGSDTPFVDIKDSLEIINEFFKKYNFSQEDIENIMYNTANKFI